MDKYVDLLENDNEEDDYNAGKYMNTANNLEHDGDKIDFYYNSFMKEQKQKNMEDQKDLEDQDEFNDQEEWDLNNKQEEK